MKIEARERTSSFFSIGRDGRKGIPSLSIPKDGIGTL
jgi:hypothetical protein